MQHNKAAPRKMPLGPRRAQETVNRQDELRRDEAPMPDRSREADIPYPSSFPFEETSPAPKKPLAGTTDIHMKPSQVGPIAPVTIPRPDGH